MHNQLRIQTLALTRIDPFLLTKADPQRGLGEKSARACLERAPQGEMFWLLRIRETPRQVERHRFRWRLVARSDGALVRRRFFVRARPGPRRGARYRERPLPDFLDRLTANTHSGSPIFLPDITISCGEQPPWNSGDARRAKSSFGHARKWPSNASVPLPPANANGDGAGRRPSGRTIRTIARTRSGYRRPGQNAIRIIGGTIDAQHPEYAERNRARQRHRAQDRATGQVAKMDASKAEMPIPSGTYRLSRVVDAALAKSDAWMVEITVITAACASP
jgi:hypothetical protein